MCCPVRAFYSSGAVIHEHEVMVEFWLAVENPRNSDRNLLNCHLVHHEPGTELGSRRCQTSLNSLCNTIQQTFYRSSCIDSSVIAITKKKYLEQSCWFWRVLTMVYNTQDSWVLTFPSSGILETRKHDVSGTGSVSVLSPEEERDPISETSCFLVSRTPDDGKVQKTKWYSSQVIYSFLKIYFMRL
jgi:hypothetical protein